MKFFSWAEERVPPFLYVHGGLCMSVYVSVWVCGCVCWRLGVSGKEKYFLSERGRGAEHWGFGCGGEGSSDHVRARALWQMCWQGATGHGSLG